MNLAHDLISSCFHLAFLRLRKHPRKRLWLNDDTARILDELYGVIKEALPVNFLAVLTYLPLQGYNNPRGSQSADTEDQGVSLQHYAPFGAPVSSNIWQGLLPAVEFQTQMQFKSFCWRGPPPSKGFWL